MTLRLTNTLTRRTEAFQPLVPGEVSIYCCGVTVYDLCHLGHARSYIVWDVLRRYLIWSGYRVTFVQNITDIDDKILRRAAEEDTSMEEVSERNITAFRDDMAALNILPPDKVPRATQCLEGIRAMIGELEASGAAYSADGDVYFAVLGQPDYGKLSGRSLSEQQEGASGRLQQRGGNPQASSLRFRPLERGQTRRAELPLTLGSGSARLAHRMLGDGASGTGHHHRHSPGRIRPDLPPP